jgi:hypothetical protein
MKRALPDHSGTVWPGGGAFYLTRIQFQVYNIFH